MFSCCILCWRVWLQVVQFISDAFSYFYLQESILADHFSSFGELSSVVLEDTETHNHDATLKPSLSCSACVTYTTRQSAEKAFIGGRSCKGHSLRFMWLTASPGSNNHSRPQNTSVPIRVSSPVGKISSTGTSCTAAIPHNKSISTAKSANTSPVEISKASGSSSSLSSNDECAPEHGSTRKVISDSALPQWGILHWLWIIVLFLKYLHLNLLPITVLFFNIGTTPKYNFFTNIHKCLNKMVKVFFMNYVSVSKLLFVSPIKIHSLRDWYQSFFCLIYWRGYVLGHCHFVTCMISGLFFPLVYLPNSSCEKEITDAGKVCRNLVCSSTTLLVVCSVSNMISSGLIPPVPNLHMHGGHQ